MSKNRSPREVCSITDGITRFDGFMWLLNFPFLTVRRPEFRLGCLLFLFGRPNLFARIRELTWDALHLRRNAVERVAETDVLPQLLEPARLAQAQERLVDVVARELGLLAYELLDLGVLDREAELVGGGLEHELACNRA